MRINGQCRIEKTAVNNFRRVAKEQPVLGCRVSRISERRLGA